MRIAVTFVLIGTAVSAQTTQGGLTLARPSSLEPPVRDAPYSVELHQVIVSASRNGISGNETRTASKILRDSQGRIRQEQLDTTARGGPRLVIILTDAAASRRCFLDTEGKVAHCFSSIRIEPFQLPSNLTTEDLGSKTIEGLQVKGKRYTQSAAGQQVNFTSEVWTSPELQIAIQTDRNEPQAGRLTISTTNLRREEPPANLFEIPPNYRIVNETGDRAVLFAPQSTSLAAGPIRPGNGVSQPQLIEKVEPKYTEEATRNKVEGTVTLSLVVAEDGTATSIKVVKSLDPGLDQQAIDAVSQWRFQPGQKDGKPVPVMANIEVNFRLLDRQ
jgi:TonB family protein